MTEINDDALLAAVMRRLLTDTNTWGAMYRRVDGDPDNPEQGLGLWIEHDMDISPEEYHALRRAGPKGE